jgi:hypothetical protein
VIWSGNGYHVLVPLQPLDSILENTSEFAKFTEPSKYILRFLEKHLSGAKFDKVHNSTVSFGNCMLRVPVQSIPSIIMAPIVAQIKSQS